MLATKVRNKRPDAKDDVQWRLYCMRPGLRAAGQG